MPQKRVAHDEVAVMLDLLFDLPPDVQPDIDETLGGVDPVEGRRCVVARLASAYRRGDSPIFQVLFERLGIGEEEGNLRALVGDAAASPGARATAMEILAGEDASLHEELLESIPEGQRRAIIDEPLRELIADAIEDTVAAEAIAVVAEHFPREAREALEADLERLRKAMGAPATTIYEHLLRSKELEHLHGVMIEALVEEAAPDGLRLLESVRGAGGAISLDDAIARIRERIEAGTSACLHATGRLGPIDSTGRFEAGILCTNDDGSRTLAMLLVRGEEILDGFADFDPPEEFIASGHVPRVEVSAESVAHLVAPALRAADCEALDSMTLGAVRLFERIGSTSALPAAEPAERVTAEEVENLMSRREYRMWAFTAADFHAAGVSEPPADPDDAWITDAVLKLDSPERRERLSRVADVMSRRHLAAGDVRAASILARIARDAHERFPEMFCVREMVRRSVAMLNAPDPEDDGEDIVDPDDLVDRAWDPENARHEVVLGVVERQIADGSPACVKDTWEALCGRGMSDSEAKSAIANVLREEICAMLAAGRPNGNGHYAEALRTLL